MNSRTSHQKYSVKKCVLEDFSNFMRKYLEYLFNTVTDLQVNKRDSNTGVFP